MLPIRRINPHHRQFCGLFWRNSMVSCQFKSSTIFCTIYRSACLLCPLASLFFLLIFANRIDCNCWCCYWSLGKHTSDGWLSESFVSPLAGAEARSQPQPGDRRKNKMSVESGSKVRASLGRHLTSYIGALSIIPWESISGDHCNGHIRSEEWTAFDRSRPPAVSIIWSSVCQMDRLLLRQAINSRHHI